ncbi:hypothetical protein E4U53_001032 [Claviceps sorghi]|nr:hypothetical protein E4U53_001032 [Claviceps sorghi]
MAEADFDMRNSTFEARTLTPDQFLLFAVVNKSKTETITSIQAQSGVADKASTSSVEPHCEAEQIFASRLGALQTHLDTFVKCKSTSLTTR